MIKLKELVLESQRQVELTSKLKKLELDLRVQYPQIKSLVLSIRTDDALYVGAIRISPRNKGDGTKVMKELIEFAKNEGIPIVLEAVPSKGKEDALKRFYDRLGFASNTGDTFDPNIKPSQPNTRYIKPKKNT